MTWNNVYLGTPNPVGNYQGSAASTTLSDLSISGSLDVNNIDAGAITGTVITGTSAFSRVGENGILIDSTGTTASATSATVGDGEFGIFESTNSVAVLVWRSGNTTYAWSSSNGSVG